MEKIQSTPRLNKDNIITGSDDSGDRRKDSGSSDVENERQSESCLFEADFTVGATTEGKTMTFDLDDAKWLSYLREHGYVVLKKVLSHRDVEEVKTLIWNDLCRTHHNMCRDDPSTWDNWRLPYHGIDASLAQTAGPWKVRGNVNVQKVFSTIWDTTDLITSMDAVILWRSDQSHDTEGLHLDQNPFTKPELDCIQGMIPLLPVNQEIGGLQVVPFSHTTQAKKLFCEKYPEIASSGDFVQVSTDKKEAVLLECEPGDLLLWDSRTIHGGELGPKAADLYDERPRLTRMSITVAMTPRAWATEETLNHRRKGFANGTSFNHCPHEAGSSTGTIHAKRKKGYKKFELSESQVAVL